jgi:threonine dehydratase
MTPLINYDGVYLKREDLNITGSAKDRAIPAQLLPHIKHAVISSSGNAAISAQHFCRLNNIKLTIFVSPHTDPKKLALLDNYQISQQPISDAFKFAKNNKATFIRQSTDPNALIGYQSIGKEIVLQCPQITSLFIPVGSGTTLLGISQVLPKSVKIFAVQPASHCPIASKFDHHYTPEVKTSTDALSVKMLPLKGQVILACFSGVVIQDQDIKNSIDTSAEGNLAFAGYQKVKDTQPVGDFPVILLTGTKR